MESMRMAGLALTVRAMATICLGVFCLQLPGGIGLFLKDHQRFLHEARMHGSVRTEASLICAFARGTFLAQISKCWVSLTSHSAHAEQHRICAYSLPPHQPMTDPHLGLVLHKHRHCGDQRAVCWGRMDILHHRLGRPECAGISAV